MSKAGLSGSVCGYLIALVACATGGGGDGVEDAAVTPRDSSNVLQPDARIRLDGGMVTPTPDAYVTPTADAATGPFCSTNNQCTVSGECCVTLGGPQGFCAPGTVVLGQCVPQ